jgi:hypothetical protein
MAKKVLHLCISAPEKYWVRVFSPENERVWSGFVKAFVGDFFVEGGTTAGHGTENPPGAGSGWGTKSESPNILLDKV